MSFYRIKNPGQNIVLVVPQTVPPVSWNDPKAECYCLSGAVRKVTPHKFAELAIFIVYELAWHLPKQFKSVVEFNDSFQTDHKDVLNYLDKVIAIKKRVAERSIKNEQN